jgi:hypothetical protein
MITNDQVASALFSTQKYYMQYRALSLLKEDPEQAKKVFVYSLVEIQIQVKLFTFILRYLLLMINTLLLDHSVLNALVSLTFPLPRKVKE